MTESEEILSVEQAAEYLGKSRGTVYRLLTTGELEKSQQTKKTRIDRSVLDEYKRLAGIQNKTPPQKRVTVVLDSETIARANKFGLVASNLKGELMELNEIVKLAVALAWLNKENEEYLSALKKYI